MQALARILTTIGWMLIVLLAIIFQAGLLIILAVFMSKWFNLFLITFQIIVVRADFGIASGAVISVWGRHIGAWLSLDSPMPAWRISVTNCGGHFLNN